MGWLVRKAPSAAPTMMRDFRRVPQRKDVATLEYETAKHAADDHDRADDLNHVKAKATDGRISPKRLIGPGQAS